MNVKGRVLIATELFFHFKSNAEKRRDNASEFLIGVDQYGFRLGQTTANIQNIVIGESEKQLTQSF